MTSTTTWSRWMAAALAERNWTQADLIRKSHNRLDEGLVSRWLSGENVPQLPNIRIVCRALGVPAVEGMIAAGRLEPGDVGVTLIRSRVQPADMSARELGEEVNRRLRVAESVESPEAHTGGDYPENADNVRPALGLKSEGWAARRRKGNEPDTRT